MSPKCYINKYNPNYNLLKDPNWLYNKYIENNIPPSKIAILCNCSSVTVIKYLKIYNLFLSKNKKVGLISSNINNENWLYTEYIINSKSIKQISNECNCSIDTARSRLIEFNISRRDTRFKKGRIQSKEQIEHNRQMHLGRKLSLKTKKLISIKARGRKIQGHPHTDEYKRSHSGPNHWNWKGGTSFGKYCNKFTYIVREYVRNNFGRKCFICEKPEVLETRKLAVHHCDYNRSQGCKGFTWSLVPLCMKCHARTNTSKWYWFNLLRDYWIYKYDNMLLFVPNKI